MDSDWMSQLEPPDYHWYSRYPSASDSEIETLTRFFGRPLPRDYELFLRKYGGGELSFRDQWRLHLWQAKDIPLWCEAYGFVLEHMIAAVAFADNLGGEATVFDLRDIHPDGVYPVVLVNFVSIGWEDAVPVAGSFRDLLLRRVSLFS